MTEEQTPLTEPKLVTRAHGVDVDAIEMLIAETHRPVAEVQDVYIAELTRLEQDARLPDYVPLFAYRKARESLLARHRSS